jgi:chorismate synthase
MARQLQGRYLRFTSIPHRETQQKMDTRVERGEAQEDSVTGAIERQTSQVPSSLFLGLAVGAMAASLVLKIARKERMTGRCL